MRGSTGVSSDEDTVMTDTERDRNLVSLREHVESLFDSADKALVLVRENLESRLGSLEQDVRQLRDASSIHKGKDTQISATVALVFAVVGAIGVIIGIIGWVF